MTTKIQEKFVPKGQEKHFESFMGRINDLSFPKEALDELNNLSPDGVKAIFKNKKKMSELEESNPALAELIALLEDGYFSVGKNDSLV